MLNIMGEYNLTADELLLIYLTFISRDEEPDNGYFHKWYNNNGHSQLKSLFESLKNKGVIKKNYNPKVFDPNEIEFNSNFIKKYFKHSGVLGQELFDNYEQFININGKIAPLRGIAKKFNSLDDFYFHYSSTIKHSVEKHKEVMNILKQAKEKKLITFGILEFVASQKWIDLKTLLESGIENVTIGTEDLYTSI